MYKISATQSKRLDIMKMILAIFVVYIHSVQQEVRISGTNLILELPIWFEYLTFSISTIISRCAVPGFFFISSILLYRKNFDWFTNFKKKFKSLLIPYIFINTLWILVFAIFQTIPQISFLFNDPENLILNFTFLRWLKAYGIGSLYPFLGPLWFLRNLFLLNVLSLFIKNVIDRFPKPFLIIIVFLWLFIPNGYFYYIDTSDICMWCFGYYVVKYNLDLDYFDNKKLLISLLTILMFSICLTIKAISFDSFDLQIERLSILVNLIFCYSVITYNLNSSINKLLLKYSEYSFGIYILHEMAIVFTKKVIAKVLGVNIIIQVLQYLLMPIFIIILSIIICMILKKYFSFLYSLLTGYRCNSRAEQQKTIS